MKCWQILVGLKLIHPTLLLDHILTVLRPLFLPKLHHLSDLRPRNLRPLAISGTYQAIIFFTGASGGASACATFFLGLVLIIVLIRAGSEVFGSCSCLEGLWLVSPGLDCTCCRRIVAFEGWRQVDAGDCKNAFIEAIESRWSLLVLLTRKPFWQWAVTKLLLLVVIFQLNHLSCLNLGGTIIEITHTETVLTYAVPRINQIIPQVVVISPQRRPRSALTRSSCCACTTLRRIVILTAATVLYQLVDVFFAASWLLADHRIKENRGW